MYNIEEKDKWVIVTLRSDSTVERVWHIESTEKLIETLSGMVRYDDILRKLNWKEFNFTGKDTGYDTVLKDKCYVTSEGIIHSFRVPVNIFAIRKYILYKDLGNGYGSIYDPRNFEDDIYKYRREKEIRVNNLYKRKDNFETGEKYSIYRYRSSGHSDVFRFRRGPVPGVSGKKKYASCFRLPKVHHNMSLILDPEYKEYTRKTSICDTKGLWWDDFPRTLTRSWKDNCKCRKQWQKNANKKSA